MALHTPVHQAGITGDHLFRNFLIAVGLAIALSIGCLAIIPMLAYHVEQLLIDRALASWLRTKGDRCVGHK